MFPFFEGMSWNEDFAKIKKLWTEKVAEMILMVWVARGEVRETYLSFFIQWVVTLDQTLTLTNHVFQCLETQFGHVFTNLERENRMTISNAYSYIKKRLYDLELFINN